MKKRIIYSLVLMLGLYAQEAMALRLRIRVPSGSSDGSTGGYTWIVYIIVGVLIVIGLYQYFLKAKATLRQFGSGLRTDSNSNLSQDQQRKMLLSAIYAENDKCYLNTIKTGLVKDDCAEQLKRDWGIYDHSSAIDALDDLKLACTKDYMPNIAEAFKLKEQKAIEQYLNETFVNKNEAKACSKQIERAFKTIGNLVKEGIVRDEADFTRIGGIGFEATRLVFIARMCAEKKYISEEEMWQYVDFVDELVHKSLSSWEDYGKSYIIGYTLWGADSYSMGQTKKIFNKLISDPKSPWTTFSFAKKA
ncbi:MAG: DUF1266 domain-containing protein [Prevotella salivae]|nr:DUF1266 domain-containing protein [Segatella salivae]